MLIVNAVLVPIVEVNYIFSCRFSVASYQEQKTTGDPSGKWQLRFVGNRRHTSIQLSGLFSYQDFVFFHNRWRESVGDGPHPNSCFSRGRECVPARDGGGRSPLRHLSAFFIRLGL